MSHVRVVPGVLRGVPLLGLLVAACGGGHASPADAPGPCWPLEATPGGQAELGTGDITFEPFPAMLPIIRDGSQSDPYLAVHARIHGLPPGNPNDILDPGNPHTKTDATIDELGLKLGVECPGSLAYVASPEGGAGAFDLIHSLRIGFGTMPLAQVVGKQVRITLVVVGSNGLYAQDTKLATLTFSAPVSSAGR
jgi:hypothetical protein